MNPAKQHFQIRGEAKNTNPSSLQKALESFLGEIKHCSTSWGYEFEFNSPGFELYFSSFDEINFNIDVDFSGSRDKLFSLLENLKGGLLEAMIEFEIWFLEVDENDDQISDDELFWKT